MVTQRLCAGLSHAGGGGRQGTVPGERMAGLILCAPLRGPQPHATLALSRELHCTRVCVVRLANVLSSKLLEAHAGFLTKAGF